MTATQSSPLAPDLAEARLVDVLHSVDAYQESAQQMAEVLRSGLLNLARAKYAPGAAGRLGPQMYDGGMQASARLSVQPASHEGSEPSPGGSRFELCTPSTARTGTVPPLMWFGALPPAALRQAQADFQFALRLAVDMANSQQRVCDALTALNLENPDEAAVWAGDASSHKDTGQQEEQGDNMATSQQLDEAALLLRLNLTL